MGTSLCPWYRCTLPAYFPSSFCLASLDILGTMQLQDDDIREFSDLWKEEFNEILTISKAREYASLLLELYWLLAQPLPGEPPGAPEDSPTATHP